MPLTRRVPKRGFTNINRIEYVVINIQTLEKLAGDSIKDITFAFLKESGLVKSRDKRVKILGRGEITKPLNVHAHAFSRSAREKIIAAGGKVEVIVQ